MSNADTCRLRVAPYLFRGEIRLAADALHFEGDTTLTLPLCELRDVQPVEDQALLFTHSGGQFTLEFDHASAAARWGRRLGKNKT